MAVGTVPYMSPEQARGEELDARTDLFSFGAVLYEDGDGEAGVHRRDDGDDSRSDSGPGAVAAPASVNARIPRELDGIIGKALEKDRDLRYQHASEMRADLKRVKRDTESGRSAAASARTPAPRSRFRPWLLRAVAVILVTAAVVVSGIETRRTVPSVRLPPVQPTHRQVTFVGDATWPALSPDGKFVAYVTGKDAPEQRLMLQDLQGGPAIELSKANYISAPRWSPDGVQLAVRRSDPPQYGVFLTPRLGGPSRLIAAGKFPCWSPEGAKIAVALEPEAGFRIIDKLTGSVESTHLTGFRYLLGLDWSRASNLVAVLTELENGRRAIWTVRPDGSHQRKVIEENQLDSPRWSAAGDAVYFLRTGQSHTLDLLKIAIDPKTGDAKGSAAALWTGLQTGDYFTASADGTRLAYSRSQRYSNLRLVQFQSHDKGKGLGKGLGKGPQTPLTAGTSKFDSPSISPDGKWIAYVNEGHICKMPVGGGGPVQLTFSNGTDFSPAWSPDGRRIAFGSNEGGAYKVWVVDSGGADRQQFVNTHLDEETDAQVAWSPGRDILYQKPGNRNFNILNAETGDEKALVPNESVGWLFSPAYSPDGRKVAVYWNRGAEGGVWLISLVDNSATLLARRWCYPAGWSPDGRSVYAYCGNSVRLIHVGAAAADSPPIVLTVSGEIAGASVSQDGNNFVYSLAETKSDVWIVDNFDPAYRK